MASTLTMGRVWGRDGLSRDAEDLVLAEPLGFAAGDTNLFRYVGNDPTDSIDPDGLKRYKFPTVYQTIGDLSKSKDVQKAWNDSFVKKSSKSPWSADHEEGGWIYYNPDAKEYKIVIAGPERQYHTGPYQGHIDLSNPPPSPPGFVQIGDFHSHPFPGGRGASPNDKANRSQAPRSGYPGYIINRSHPNPGDVQRVDIQPYDETGKLSGHSLEQPPKNVRNQTVGSSSTDPGF